MIDVLSQEYAVERYGDERYAEGYSEGYAEGYAKGLIEGAVKCKKALARRMQEYGFSEEDIADCVSTDLTIVRQWLSERPDGAAD